jgi:hypothetical protein
VLISSTLDKSQVQAHVAPQLHECVLTFCVKTVKSSYSLGMYHEDIVRAFPNHTTGDWPWSTFAYDDGSTDQTYLENVTIRTPLTGPKQLRLGLGFAQQHHGYDDHDLRSCVSCLHYGSE